MENVCAGRQSDASRDDLERLMKKVGRCSWGARTA